ncbi:MAG: hypothetical protein HOW73_50015 [Polyangiaceae bacterium]|nr:hypothetical protein [Polyangiaceae bacterium]
MTVEKTLQIVLCVVAVSSGCGSPARYAAERRAGMLAEFPPGTTSRADVRVKWGHDPDFSEVRPAAGWSAHPWPAVAARALTAERRSGQLVARIERYSGPDLATSSFLSLHRGWYFYDAANVVVDVDWEYMSD